MCKVVHRVDLPLISRTVVGMKKDAVDHRVPHMHIGGGHINFGPEHPGTLWKLARIHALEQVQVLFHATIPKGTVRSRFGGSAFLTGNLFGRLVIHIGQPLLNQVGGKVVELFKVIGGKILPVFPVKSKPVNVLLDGIHKLHILLGGIGIVETEIALSAILLSYTKIETDGLGMTNMKVAVGLRRKACMHPFIIPAAANIFLNHGLNKIEALLFSGIFFMLCHFSSC